MYSLDRPNELKFSRPGRLDSGIQSSQAKAGWADVLMGKALEEYLTPHVPNQSTLEKLRGTMNSGNVVRMGQRS